MGVAGGQPADDIIDRAEIMERVDGDVELLAEIVELFLSDCPRLLSEIREAIERRDSKALERAAHALKGSVSNFAATAAFEAALRLENIGSNGDMAHAEEAYAALEEEVKYLEPALAGLGKGGAQ
jgi:HPt (histidine-containing phosphotransfer) domain-containing protein